MLIDRRGRVFVAQRIDTPGEAWQMPQGGIEPGESPRRAALRELHEEIGTDKAEVLAESRNWRRYDPLEAVAVRFAFVLRYLETAWADPELPLELLPAGWPAIRAHEIAATLRKNLKDPLLEYGDHVLQSLPEVVRQAVAF